MKYLIFLHSVKAFNLTTPEVMEVIDIIEDVFISALRNRFLR
jgi:hypothetical protein